MLSGLFAQSHPFPITNVRCETDKQEDTPEAFTADLRPLANYFWGFMMLDCCGLSARRSLTDHLRWCPVAIVNFFFFDITY